MFNIVVCKKILYKIVVINKYFCIIKDIKNNKKRIVLLF